MGRRYSQWRRAWMPRWWPAWLVAAPVSAVVCTAFFADDVLLTILASSAITFAVTSVQWWLWRRRHPILSIAQRAREEAPWN